MNDLNAIWSGVVEKLYLQMTNAHFNSWILPLVPLKIDENSIYIKANINLVKKVVSEKYLDSIQKEIREATGKNLEVVILEPRDERVESIMKNLNIEKDGQVSMINPDSQEPLPVIKKNVYNYSLNPKYTFDNFVRGTSNSFALAVAEKVSSLPGTEYNPLFIYGGSGLGKTHLMQAIGHAILKRQPETKVLYITSENFMNEFIQTITDSKNSVINSQKFREKYRNCDVLMIDDIQFIAGKEGTQEEIFHTFNSLREAKKQIILTSDKVPKDIKNLEERLVTRFAGGMLADIQYPDYETRVAILNHKVKMDKINNAPDALIEYIANNVTSNIRELEGALLKVMAYVNLTYKDKSNFKDDDFIKIAKDALLIEDKKEKVISLDYIKNVVADFYSITKNDLISKSRQQNIARPRQIAMYLSRNLTDLSLIKIANSFDRDHSTIMHGCEKIEAMMNQDLGFSKEIKGLISKIKE
ncbi:MAG: chromosomal replication initiator protein DnaA [Tissierellia bacterium]|nr:chromosomal replication initiator protein DnaA [Tissierellia bacterium]